MEPALQRRVQRYGWDKAANFYEGFWQKQLLPAQQKLLEFANINGGERIIDIASGTGLVSFPAAELTGSNGYVLGTDISDKMVELSIAIVKERNISNLHFERMDAEELTAKDETFDIALCALGLMYVTDYLKALKEMHRVLKAGGSAVAAVWGQRNNCGWADLFEIVDRRVSSEVCPMFFNLGNAGMLQNYFAAAGFTDIKEERISNILFYASDEDAIGAAFLGGPVALAYNKFTDEVKRQVQQEYIDSITPFKKDNGYYVPGEFVVVAGCK
jgi:ubiquinone/menaquinone biosynthesis C-methylase UbiE